MLRDSMGSARWTIALTWFWLLGCFGQTASYLWQISLLRDLGSGSVAPDVIDHATAAPQFGHVLFMLLTFLYHIVFYRWVYVINRNAHQWSDSMTISPGWNVGWFFVPVATWWKPFEGIRESRGATIAPAAPETVEVPIWLRIWWGLWLAAIGHGNIVALIGRAAETPEQWISVSWMNMASIVIDLPLAILTFRLVSDISTLQSTRIATASAIRTGANHHAL